ncbi:MAG: hypothetical protein ACLFM8_03625 [Halobacteriales archaeon]
MKTIGAIAGGGVLAGRAGARPGPPATPSRGPKQVLAIEAYHDHHTGEHGFELNRSVIDAGWTTLIFDNQTDHSHFVYAAKVPVDHEDFQPAEGQSLLEYYVEEVTIPFQGLMDLLLGETPRHDPTLPDWFGTVVPAGGTGLTAGGLTAKTTIDLAPGEYIVECYVKESNPPYEDFHSYHGMIEHVTVRDRPAGTSPPRADLALTVDNGGMVFDTDAIGRPGRHTVKIDIEEQQAYPNLLGHDAHLIRLEGSTTADDVNGWMNWMAPGELVSDGSDPTTFLGGVETMWPAALPATAYVDVTLTPGEYAWVSEVPDPIGEGLFVPFDVPRGR